MEIVTQEKVELVIKKLQEKAEPWINLLLKEDPNILYKGAIVILLCTILALMLKNGSKKTENSKISKRKNSAQIAGGHKNFKGDTWYSDGWIWDKKTQSWKAPDFQTHKAKRPDKNISPSGWHWNEIEGIWEPPDIEIKENNERWRWDNVRGIWIDLNKEDK